MTDRDPILARLYSYDGRRHDGCPNPVADGRPARCGLFRSPATCSLDACSTTTGIVRARTAEPATPAARPGMVAAALTIIGLTLLASAAAAGYLVGLRSAEHEEIRTRRAVCLLLDYLGADPGSAAEVYPCSTEPTR